MATPQMRVQGPAKLEKLEAAEQGERRYVASRRHAALRLLAAERSEEIYPVLLEEIVALGFPRAMLEVVDFDAGVLAPVASINCSKKYQQRFRTTLWAAENPIVRVLHSGTPTVLPDLATGRNPLYCHPIVFRSRNLCWEAEREHRSDCLALANYRRERKVQLQEQLCSICEIRAYAGVVLVDLTREHSERDLADVRSLIEIANRYLSRIFRTEHHYNRMTDMEVTIRQMQTVMQSMADPVILTDAQHRVITQNQAAERFFKVPENVSEGRIRAVELNNLLFSAALSSMSVSGGEASRDLTLVDAIEGEEMLFEAVCAPTYGREGLRTGLVTVMRDVTDLRRADEEVRANLALLRQAEELVRQDRDRLNLIVENVGDPIVVSDGAAKIVLVDPLAQELFGSENADRSPIQLRNQAKLDAYVTGFTFSFSDREGGPLRLVHPGSRIEIEYDARSGKIYDERGQVAFTVTVLRDLTAVRKVEQLKLEHRMLEIEKFAATGRLAGTIAHEVNNPMEAIKNAIYLLAGKLRPEATPVYDILKSETERVARIVRQMLGLYRNTDQIGSVDVNNVMEDTLLLFSRQLERGGIRVETRLDKLPALVGSADQLRQVLSNLVVNAKDGMPQGGQLVVRTRHLPALDGIHGWVRIVVADDGSGIPESMLHSIFEPFVTTKGEKGTGLGLWIVKGIIENHAGKIRVRSKPGRGTVFKIDLPVVR
ncbi:MAG TPA: ATP-binding protein [Terriglobales bacterium]|nr:ATP-binding protein [Terriglobales bacterium]